MNSENIFVVLAVLGNYILGLYAIYQHSLVAVFNFAVIFLLILAWRRTKRKEEKKEEAD